jgi:hypothetical protein
MRSGLYNLTGRGATGSSTLTVTSRSSKIGPPVDPGLTSSTLVGHNWTSHDLSGGSGQASAVEREN